MGRRIKKICPSSLKVHYFGEKGREGGITGTNTKTGNSGKLCRGAGKCAVELEGKESSFPREVGFERPVRKRLSRQPLERRHISRKVLIGLQN